MKKTLIVLLIVNAFVAGAAFDHYYFSPTFMFPIPAGPTTDAKLIDLLHVESQRRRSAEAQAVKLLMEKLSAPPNLRIRPMPNLHSERTNTNATFNRRGSTLLWQPRT